MLSRLKWLELDFPTRLKIAETFDIPKKGGTIVEGHTVITDGFREQDLALLTVERMQQFLGTTSTDFYALFDQVANKLNANYVEPTQGVETEVTDQTGHTSKPDEGTVSSEPTAPRRGRPKKVTSPEGIDPVSAN